MLPVCCPSGVTRGAGEIVSGEPTTGAGCDWPTIETPAAKQPRMTHRGKTHRTARRERRGFLPTALLSNFRGEPLKHTPCATVLLPALSCGAAQAAFQPAQILSHPKDAHSARRPRLGLFSSYPHLMHEFEVWLLVGDPSISDRQNSLGAAGCRSLLQSFHRAFRCAQPGLTFPRPSSIRLRDGPSRRISCNRATTFAAVKSCCTSSGTTCSPAIKTMANAALLHEACPANK